MQNKVEIIKPNRRAYEDLYDRLNTKEGDVDLYWFARKKNKDGKEVWVMGRQKDNFEGLMSRKCDYCGAGSRSLFLIPNYFNFILSLIFFIDIYIYPPSREKCNKNTLKTPKHIFLWSGPLTAR